MFKKILSLFIILISLTSCKAEFIEDKVIGFTKHSTENPFPSQQNEPPYEWEDLKATETINCENIVSNEANQFNPDIYGANVTYIDQRWGTDEIYLNNNGENIRVTNRDGDPNRKSHPIWDVKVHERDWILQIAWIEKGERWSIYTASFDTWNQRWSPSHKIHEFEMTNSNPDVYRQYLSSFQVTENGIFWNQPTDQNFWIPEAYFYSWDSQTTEKLEGIHAYHFEIDGDWIIYTPEEDKKYIPTSYPTSYTYHLMARNLVTGIKFQIGSDESASSDSFVVDNGRVLWIDYRFSRPSIFSQDLQDGLMGSETLFFLLPSNIGVPEFELKSLQGDILYVKDGSWGKLVAVNLSTLALYDLFRLEQVAPGSLYDIPVNFNETRAVTYKNDSLIKGNNDILLCELK